MAIEPSGIVRELDTIKTADDIQPTLSRIYSLLPTCINRAIGTLQCAQLDDGYKKVNARLLAELEFDVHQAFKDQVALILARKR